MEQYTKRTGGGSGLQVLFAVRVEAYAEQHKKWSEQPVGWIAQYTGQMSTLYLEVVLTWDTNFGYMLNVQKDPMPDDCMIADSIAEGGGNNDDNQQFIHTPIFSTASLRNSSGK